MLIIWLLLHEPSSFSYHCHWHIPMAQEEHVQKCKLTEIITKHLLLHRPSIYTEETVENIL